MKKWNLKPTSSQSHPHEEIDAEGSWAVSYGDMVTLLLCFFILFFSVKPDSKNAKEIQSAVFNLLSSTSNELNKENRRNPSTESAAASADNNIISYGDKPEQGVSKEILLKFNGVPHQIGQQIIIEFPGISFFDSGQTHLTKEGVQEMIRFAKIFTPYSAHFDIGIRAFTDIKPVKNSPNLPYKNNLELSALRSVKTMQVLLKNGIPHDNIRLGGFGELRLTAKQLAELPAEKRKINSEFDLARKVVLVLEQKRGVE